MNDTSQDIIFSELTGKGGNIGHILLNRPKALNALSLDMCKSLREQLKQWQADNQIKAVIIEGEGDRAFCAGGDIRLLYERGREDSPAALDFFRNEYRMNAAIFHFNKPYISFLDGITMGGGAGVSMHGSHRVATERLNYAMPETGIGFFPDIGAGYFLTRLIGRVGHYLGLTGDRIGPADALQFGIVTQAISSNKVEQAKQMLIESPFASKDFEKVSELINQFSADMGSSKLTNFRHEIDDCFDTGSVEETFTRLKEVNSEWSLKVLKQLQSKSPTSLKVTFEQLRRAVNMEFDAIMKMEFHMAAQFLQTPDFYEGVRAAIIDKDQSPNWKPNRLGAITDDDVQKYFLGDENLELD